MKRRIFLSIFLIAIAIILTKSGLEHRDRMSGLVSCLYARVLLANQDVYESSRHQNLDSKESEAYRQYCIRFAFIYWINSYSENAIHGKLPIEKMVKLTAYEASSRLQRKEKDPFLLKGQFDPDGSLRDSGKAQMAMMFDFIPIQIKSIGNREAYEKEVERFWVWVEQKN